MGLLHFSTLPFFLWGLCYEPMSGIRSWDNGLSSLIADPLTGAQHPDLFAAWDSSKDAQWFLGWGNWQQQPQGQWRCRQLWRVVRHEPHPSCPLAAETWVQLQAGHRAAAASLLPRRHPLCPGVTISSLLGGTMGLYRLWSDSFHSRGVQGASASCTIMFYTLRKITSFMCFQHHLTGFCKSGPLGKSASHWLFWSANVCFVVPASGTLFNKLCVQQCTYSTPLFA